MVADITDLSVIRGEREAEGSKPIIEVRAGELPRLVEEAQQALIEGDAGIYQRGGQLSRIVRLTDTTRMHGIERRAGSAIIAPVSKEYLILALARFAAWRQYDHRKKKLRAINPPPAIANGLLAMSGEWKFPSLTGLIAAPTLRSDGTPLEAAGYDVASGLYGDFVPGDFTALPKAPSREDAISALRTLEELLCEFEFAGGPHSANAAAAIAAIITACVRHALPIAPGYGLNAHKAGSGKTTLGHTIARIPTGRDAAVMPLADEEGEVRKALLSILMAADMMVLIDNIAAPVDSAAVCAALTSETYKDRILGESRTVSLPTASTWLFNGNNLEFVGDLTSRIILSTLDPQCEQPESRTFRRDLQAYVTQHRGELVRAVLTIPMAYLAAAEPAVKAKPSRFKAWDRFVRRPLLWLGAADPLATQEDLRNTDPIRAALIAIMSAWHEAFGDKPATVAQAVDLATGPGQSGHPRLLEALTDVAGERNGAINSRRLGRWLVKHLRRIEGGRRFEDAGEDALTHRRRFKVSGVSGVSGVSANAREENCSANNPRGPGANADNASNAGDEDFG